MHRMTRDVAHTQVSAPFLGESFTLHGDTVHMRQIAGARELILDKSDGSEIVYGVTKVIGGRFREDFVGIELGSTVE